MRTILVPGTHSWRNDDAKAEWFWPRSPFAEFLLANGVNPLFAPRPKAATTGDLQPFVWSTDLGGIGFGSSDLIGWAAAGIQLYQFAVPPLCPERQISGDNLALVLHSHALQVGLFACAQGLKVKTLISVGSPIRKDMEATAKLARPNIGYWLHIHSDGSDKMQWLGELFDGHWGIVREAKLADKNDFVPKVGHSEVLRNPEHFHFWVDRGWIDYLKG